MIEIFQQLNKAIEQKENTVLVTVISSVGSTPRGEGARMLVSEHGRIAGTIGGGAVEFRSEQVAKNVLENKKAVLEKFILAPNEIEDIGMICGGNVEVLFQYLSYEDPTISEICKKIQEHSEKNDPCWLICEIGDSPTNHLSFYSSENSSIGQDAKLFQENSYKQGLSIHTYSDHTYLIESLVQKGKVYIFGGGHVAQALVPVLKRLDFYCIVLDDREKLLTEEFFPEADQRIVVDLKEIKQKVQVTNADYAVVMTRGHQFDFELTRQLLTTEAYYIGVMGSKHKIAVQIKRLQESGFNMNQIDRVNMPIGLKIDAETPAELAISIAGELIEKRAKR